MYRQEIIAELVSPLPREISNFFKHEIIFGTYQTVIFKMLINSVSRYFFVWPSPIFLPQYFPERNKEGKTAYNIIGLIFTEPFSLFRDMNVTGMCLPGVECRKFSFFRCELPKIGSVT